MPLLQSTLESPLLFLHHYLRHNGTIILKQRFVSSKAPNYHYNEEQNVIVAQAILPRTDQRGELLDPETNTREYTITFKEYVAEEFRKQLSISKNLIRDKRRKNDLKQNLEYYREIINECYEFQRWVDAAFDLRFRKDIQYYITGIGNYSWKIFSKKYPAIPEIRQVKRYLDISSKAKETGFRLEIQQRNGSIDEFIEYLKDRKFISPRTKKKYLIQFFNGRIPDHKINWIKAPHELVFFIRELCHPSILHTPPKQPWKDLDLIFKNDGENLPENWHRNHNKLKNDVKKAQILRAIHLIRPRIAQ
ncbi:hypothetical protein [uncultured Draconibacterium sp.]|uniref:hypothetical protein n=1 Tax=uncultured Draconibacterium sp. TaxID=1573823 RepID=UPI0032166A49